MPASVASPASRLAAPVELQRVQQQPGEDDHDAERERRAQHSNGWLSGCSHSAGSRLAREHAAEREAERDRRDAARHQQPQRGHPVSQCESSRGDDQALHHVADMKPNISGAMNATTTLGSASRVPGTPIRPPNTSKGRAHAGLRSTDGGTVSSGAGVLRSR